VASARKFDVTISEKPGCPRPTHVVRQYQLIPKLEQLLDVNVIPNIRGGTFSQDLFVDARAVLTATKVIDLGGTTPADVKR
jgi:hypothetical protein